MRKRDEPAFPVTDCTQDNSTNAVTQHFHEAKGLTKLEYTAIHTLAALASYPASMLPVVEANMLANALWDELEKETGNER